MDLWRLHIYCKVIEHKSFSKAGKSVHLSQPTVSSHIKDLEDHFGCRLIDRLSKEALPTKAGKLLYEYARRLLALRDEAEAALSEFQGKIRGRLVVGGSTIPGGYILPMIIGAFKAEFPEVTVALINGDTEGIIERVLAGAAELGIVGAKAGDRRIVQEKLIEDEMRLVVPPGHHWAQRKQISVAQLMDEPFIAREPGSGTLKSIQKKLGEKGLDIDDLNIVAEMGSTQSVIQGIKSGVGVSILSTIAVSDSVREGSLHALRIKGLNLERSFYLILHRYRSASPLCLVFTDFLKSHIGRMI